MKRHVVLLALCVGFLLARLDVPVGAQEKDPSPDSIIPIASGITEYKTSLDVEGKKLHVAIPYSQQGSTVFVLPVWHVRESRRILEGQPPNPLEPGDLVAIPDAKGQQRLEFDVVNLLENETLEKAIQEKLRARIAQRTGQAADQLKLAFAMPQIETKSYRFALIGPGRGDETLPAEVLISSENQPRSDRRVRLIIETPALLAVEKENGGPLNLAQTHLRCTGPMRVRFEQTQVIAQIDFVRGAVTEMRKQLASVKDAKSQSPEAFVELPEGGSVSSDHQIRSLASQSLNVTLSSRQGVDASPILSLVQAELNALLDRCKVSLTNENQRVAFLLDRQVAITATMGEIHKLAHEDEKTREAVSKAIQDDFKARASGQSTNVSESLKKSANETLNTSLNVSYLGFKGALGANYGSASNFGSASDFGSASNESSADRSKRQSEAVRKSFDRLMKRFEGKMPTLTGISFDDKQLVAAYEQATRNFEQRKLTTGYTLHRWPLIALSGQLEMGLSAEMLMRQYAILKSDFDSLQQVIAPPLLAEAKANLDRVAKQAAELNKRLAEAERVIADFEKNAQNRLKSQTLESEKALAAFEHGARAALAVVDQSAVAKLQKDLAKLKRNIGDPGFATREESFLNLEPGEKPPLLDCTGPNGADARTARAAQVAWAKFLGEKGHEGQFDLGESAKIDMVLLPPGKFLCGEGDKQTTVTITEPLWVGKYEVSQAQYLAVMGKNPSRYLKNGEDAASYPVETVSHVDSIAFCEKASKAASAEFRLLREAEWEFAYRAGTRTKYYNGDSDANLGAIAQFGGEATARVGSKSPNAFGLYDMAGNVREWCSDRYGDFGPSGIDPRGPNKGSDRVGRGGSWNSSAESCRAAYRWFRLAPSIAIDYLGLRLARVPTGSK